MKLKIPSRKVRGKLLASSDETFAAIGRKYGNKTRQYVARVVNGEFKTDLAYQIRCYIAVKISMRYDDIWEE